MRKSVYYIPHHRRLPPYTLRITTAQRLELAALRRMYGEHGYYVYPVAIWYRRTRHDYIVFLKSEPHTLIIVRPNRAGGIELRSYVLPSVHQKVNRAISSRSRKHCTLRWRRQLPALHHNYSDDWRWFIPRQYWEEVGAPRYHQP